MQEEVIKLVEKATQERPILLREIVEALEVDAAKIAHILRRLRKQKYIGFEKRRIVVVEERDPVNRVAHQRTHEMEVFVYYRRIA